MAVGPYLGVIAALLGGGIGLPIPEEIVLLGAGASVHREAAALVPMLIVSLLAVCVTDNLSFNVGRRLGPAALDRAPARWLLPRRRRARMERLVTLYGARLIFIARFLPGFRAPTFLLLGAHHMPRARFMVFDALAVALSVPIVGGIGYAASQSIQRVSRDEAHVEHVIVLAVAAAVLVFATVSAARAVLARRRVRGSGDVATAHAT